MKNFYAASIFMTFLSWSMKKGSPHFKKRLTWNILFFITMLMAGNSSLAQAPAISSFTPISGAPGTLFTITETNLSSPTAFKTGGVAASAILVSHTYLPKGFRYIYGVRFHKLQQ